jgi:hypothetical protein
MRCTPMAVWTSKLEDDFQIKMAVAEDVQMTHSN